MSTLTHITEADVEAAAKRMEVRTDPDDLSYLEPLDENQREELLALCWYGHSLNADKFDFSWHYDHFQASQITVQVSPEIMRRGLRQLRAER